MSSAPVRNMGPMDDVKILKEGGGGGGSQSQLHLYSAFSYILVRRALALDKRYHQTL
jgi:hypothetical protein